MFVQIQTLSRKISSLQFSSVYLIPFKQLHDKNTNTNKNMNGKGLKGTIVH